MKKVVIAIFMFLMSLVAFAQGNGIFWKVSGNGLSKPTYILGSHHLTPGTFIDSIAGVRDAIAAADVVYGEVRKDELVGVAAQQKMMAAAMAPADSTLSKLLSPADLAKVDSVFALFIGQRGIVGQLEMMKPSLVNTQLVMMISMKACPQLNAIEPFDVAVLNAGEKAGKPIRGLETIDDQTKLLFGEPLTDQAKSLMETVNDVEKNTQQIVELTNAYLAQDLDAVYRATTDPSYGVKEADLERLICQRNRNWVAQLDSGLMRDNSLFVVVGCGHLGGEQGVLNLLRQKGYTVECVK